ncbi:response regulator [Desulfopila aestuarii]|uniref:Response regulator receiver domain-containing protein n=1 Tax=Desulfopila aestuarii DSM 18488 TaxID=1121416 RepID=A0A1M7Y610_9BACT|nr:response regulator [Desulfopila aestuarii]SHO47957.1 Response regulator receiver domain-containing protein [Desulfopila aestuarii DSM 18488]
MTNDLHHIGDTVLGFEDLESARILVVDDNTANIDVMLAFLEAEGYDLSIATNGETAIKIARHSRPDLILLDVMMPGMNGFETCRELKADERTREIPVIFVTAKKEVEDIVSGFQSGGVDYISKPFRQEEVLSRVSTHLRLRRLVVAQERLITKLNGALAEVDTLRGLLPICSYCKKIKDEKGAWKKLETYIRTHTQANFSHGICPECLEKAFQTDT